MKADNLTNYRCPLTGNALKLIEPLILIDDDVIEGVLVSTDGVGKYLIKDGIPDFTINNEKDKVKNEYARTLFKAKAKEFDKYQHLSFETFYVDETTVRNSIIDKLNLNENSHILEVNAGTGRDSLLILKRLSEKGFLSVQDISRDMLDICKEKLQSVNVPVEIHQGDACKLPYNDKVFDAVYSFGGVGMNTYSSNKEVLAELVRVTKVNGKIVFAGLSLAPWLRDTFFGKVLINHNKHYENEISFREFPIEARDLKLNWILGGAGFVIDFSVGEGEPNANFEYEIPGPRGGSHLTRYLGNLEGVSLETKKMALKAREKLGVSMHKWLDEIIKREAEKILHSQKKID